MGRVFGCSCRSAQLQQFHVVIRDDMSSNLSLNQKTKRKTSYDKWMLSVLCSDSYWPLEGAKRQLTNIMPPLLTWFHPNVGNTQMFHKNHRSTSLRCIVSLCLVKMKTFFTLNLLGFTRFNKHFSKVSN